MQSNFQTGWTKDETVATKKLCTQQSEVPKRQSCFCWLILLTFNVSFVYIN